MTGKKRVFLAHVTGALAGVIFLLSAGISSVASQEWHPPEPSPGEKDWVQLSSGEWIHGTIDLFRDLKMEFDSDDLDDLVVDWDDIAAFRSPRVLTYVFAVNRVVTGTASMRDGEIQVSTDSGIQEFKRADQLSIIEGQPKEINFWSAKVSIGLTARSGNTDQADLNYLVKIKREAMRSQLNLDYRGNFGEVGDERTVENRLGSILYKLFLSRRFFITPASFEIYTDRFQNIDYRTTIGAGVGYYIFRQSKIDWSIGIGGGYQVTRYISVEENEDRDLRTGALIPSASLEADVTSDIEVRFDYSSNIGIPDPKTSTHHATALLSIDFFKDIFELSLPLTWDRIEKPKAYEDGTVPKRDDFRLAFGFAVDL